MKLKIGIFLLPILIIQLSALSKAPESPEKIIKPPAKVLIKIVKNKDKVDGVILQTYIKGTVDEIWGIITNSQNVPVLFSSIEKVVLIKKEATTDPKIDKNSWTYYIDAPIGKKVMKIITEDNHNVHISRWHRISGDMNVFQGEWRIAASKKYEGYVKVSYRSFIDGGTFAPQFITNKLNKEDAAGMVTQLKKKLFYLRKSKS